MGRRSVGRYQNGANNYQEELPERGPGNESGLWNVELIPYHLLFALVPINTFLKRFKAISS